MCVKIFRIVSYEKNKKKQWLRRTNQVGYIYYFIFYFIYFVWLYVVVSVVGVLVY